MELASESLSPASQYVKNHVDSFWSRLIPVLLHLIGEVQDEGAPFGRFCVFDEIILGFAP
jgi:hypothetical protein